MTDIEVKRKELETAKRIRDNGYDCFGLTPTIGCTPDCCPAMTESTGCRLWKSDDWDAFIFTREAELAALENTPRDGLSHVQTAIKTDGPFFEPFGGAGKTIDDFALALIQGMGQDAIIHHPDTLYDLAAAYKAESDRRRV